VTESLAQRLLAPHHGAVGGVATGVRIAAGLAFFAIGIGKFAGHAGEVTDFQRYGIPWASLAVYVSGIMEVMGGFLLVVGLFTRVAAFVLSVNLVIAVSTAGVVDGGVFHLGVGPALLVAMVFLLWAGGGAYSLDARLADASRPVAAT
jgi:putative oxidoreductase